MTEAQTVAEAAASEATKLHGFTPRHDYVVLAVMAFAATSLPAWLGLKLAGVSGGRVEWALITIGLVSAGAVWMFHSRRNARWYATYAEYLSRNQH
ncbi:hypothetical protein J2T49_001812 [Pseudomonas nitroreducens]|nr:hypothetical protein [Pseudomonas nitroreducens]MCP1685873.1 hypothetical protein [Pseudomonas nitroreducens]